MSQIYFKLRWRFEIDPEAFKYRSSHPLLNLVFAVNSATGDVDTPVAGKLTTGRIVYGSHVHVASSVYKLAPIITNCSYPNVASESGVIVSLVYTPYASAVY